MISIDIHSALDRYSFNKSEVNKLREYAVDIAINELYDVTVMLAQNTLNSSRNEYIRSLSIRRVNRFTQELVLSGSSLAEMIENGSGSFDMKQFFALSSKVKNTKGGGWYLTIPFLFRTSAANPRSGQAGQIMPRTIYDLIRNSPTSVQQKDTETVSILGGNAIPKRYDPKPKSVIDELTNRFGTYTPKSSIYAGLIRRQDDNTGKSTYNTFRRVSDKSDPWSWYHPGIVARNLMDQASSIVEQDNEGIVDQALSKFFE